MHSHALHEESSVIVRELDRLSAWCWEACSILSVEQILARSPLMADFKLASSRVGPEGGIAVLKALSQSKSHFSEGGFFSVVFVLS